MLNCGFSVVLDNFSHGVLTELAGFFYNEYFGNGYILGDDLGLPYGHDGFCEFWLIDPSDL
jgi:hypothetical protein